MPVRNVGQLNLQQRAEIRPTNEATIIRPVDGGSEIAKTRWWLIPFFHKGTVKEWKATTFNAKAEEITAKPTYRDAFKRRRCLIPAAGYWEWKDEGGPKKQRYWVAPRDGRRMMFAGVWDRATTGDQGDVESFSMLTIPAGALVHLHHRAPLVLWQDDWARWLDVRADVDDMLAREGANDFEIVREMEINA